MKAGSRSGPARQAVLRSDKVNLLTISFLILFLELACIRWLSAYILYLGYFTNFVLLGGSMEYLALRFS